VSRYLELCEIFRLKTGIKIHHALHAFLAWTYGTTASSSAHVG
jgi:hypothetical protein